MNLYIDYEPRTRLRVGMVISLLTRDGSREPFVVTLVNRSRATCESLHKTKVTKTIKTMHGEKEIEMNERSADQTVTPNCECPILALSVEDYDKYIKKGKKRS